MSYLPTRIVCFVAASLALSACGDIGSKPSSNSSTGTGVDIRNGGVQPGSGLGGGGGGSFDSGLAATTSVADLSGEDIAAACGQFRSYTTEQLGGAAFEENLCTAVGYVSAIDDAETDSEARQICSGIRDACLSEETNLEFDCPFEEVEGCDVTVAEVEACADAQVGLLAPLVDMASCTTVTAEIPAELEDFAFENPPECATIFQECRQEFEPPETDPVPPMGG